MTTPTLVEILKEAVEPPPLVALSDATDFILDGTHGSPERTDGGVPVLSAQNVNGGTLSFSSTRFTSLAELDAFRKRLDLRNGDVALTIVGSIGRAAVVTGVVPAVFQRSVAFLRPKAGRTDSRYLYWAFSSLCVKDQLRKATNTSTQAGIYLGRLKEVLIPLPSIDEQRRIAAILDRVDEIRTVRRQGLSRLDDLASAIFLEMFGDPVSNPRGLPCKPLPAIGHLYSGGTPSKADPENWAGNLPWFSPKDIKRDDLFDSADHIDDDLPARSSLKRLPKDTVVFVVRGMILAHTFPVSVIRVESTVNQDMKAVIPSESIDADFLATCLRVQANRVLTLVDTAAHGTKKLDARALSNIPILVPGLEAQAEFARRVAAVAEIRAHYKAQLAELNALFASLQHSAFNGGL
ncbi:restriction endonuclease subunit S [Arthrobacter ramosus]|uniref:Restriction endonuclease subunit S n=1 Tax=Arthrobacter ramosus TaxID=1672 RepID=A0ABV5XTX1_ARTRM|nr:restriction endonuclease subunit S [Arthrobacter ramosus]